MRYLVLAADYDGTLAHDGRIDDATRDGLRQLRQSGRKLLLVTGRELEDLQAVCPHLDLFDGVVAENGALLYWAQQHQVVALGEPPPAAFVEELRRRGVRHLSVGHVIVATCKPHDKQVLDVIREQGLELQLIFNRDSVMILPPGINKAFGLKKALGHFGLSRHNTVAVGDAENDHAFLSFCECGVAVANAVPALRERADLVTGAPDGAGVQELVHRLLKNDLADLAPTLTRHDIPLGTGPDGTTQCLAPSGCNVLVAGTSGSGKSTFTSAFLESLAEAQYQYVVIDPEGDYARLEGAVVLGLPERAPLLEEVLDVIDTAAQSAVVNLLGLPLAERPAFFDRLLPRLLDLRVRTGRPHWIVIDEAHHLMPRAWSPSDETMPRKPHGLFLITVHPGSVAPAMLETVHLMLAVGEAPEQTLAEFCQATRRAAPAVGAVSLQNGEFLAWRVHESARPFVLTARRSHTERRRHLRKYAEGRLSEDHSFYFRGKTGKLNLRAHNLMTFLEVADGVDDATWMHHLRAREYSQWFRSQIKDEELAREAERIETDRAADPATSRAAVRRAIERRYTLPAEPG
jgi:hydroxymethylpyrimidine pyrophosphatase-like HAD family hydrolase